MKTKVNLYQIKFKSHDGHGYSTEYFVAREGKNNSLDKTLLEQIQTKTNGDFVVSGVFSFLQCTKWFGLEWMPQSLETVNADGFYVYQVKMAEEALRTQIPYLTKFNEIAA
jgi:hypothetical protein